MSRMIRTALVVALFPAGPAAWAADATPEQARTLESQIRGWLTEMAGPAIPLPERPVQITPDGDHYRVAMPIGIAGGETATMTATARPVEGGKWSIEAIHFPVPAHFTFNLPQPPKEGQATPGPTLPVTYTVNATSQTGQALYDPTFASPTTITSGFEGFDMQASSTILQQHTQVARSASSSTIRPAGPGRVDVVSEGSLEGYTATSKAEGAEQIQIGTQRLRINGQLTGVSRDRAGPIIQAMAKLVGSAMAATSAADDKTGPATPGKMDPQAAKALLLALQDFASAFQLEESAERLEVHYGDYGGTASQARLGMGAKSDNGMLQAQMDLSVEGLALLDLPLGDMVELLPRRVAIRPVVSGVAVADLVRLINNSSEGKDAAPADVAALFSHGGIVTGLESFTIDVAGTSFTGNTKILVQSPQQVSGTAQITASNFDALMQRVSSMPQLAQAMPVFVLAKGIGRTVDNRLVWDVSYANGKTLVNNVDLNALAAGGQAQPQAPRQQPRPQPARPGPANPR